MPKHLGGFWNRTELAKLRDESGKRFQEGFVPGMGFQDRIARERYSEDSPLNETKNGGVTVRLKPAFSSRCDPVSWKGVEVPVGVRAIPRSGSGEGGKEG